MSTTEKAHVMRQVGTGKANASEPLLKCRKRSDGNRNRGPVVAPGRARGILCCCPGGCPAQRWREPGSRRWHETWEPLAVMARAGVLTLACGRENPKQLKL